MRRGGERIAFEGVDGVERVDVPRPPRHQA